MKKLRAILKSFMPYTLLPNAVAQRFILKQQLQHKILAGPFKGMHFSWAPWSDAFTVPLPKFLGTYEQELIPTIEIISHYHWAKIVDVGAADGYYAVGLALLLPGTTIIAFEELEEGRARLNEVALLNKVQFQLDVREPLIKTALPKESRLILFSETRMNRFCPVLLATVPAKTFRQFAQLILFDFWMIIDL